MPQPLVDLVGYPAGNVTCVNAVNVERIDPINSASCLVTLDSGAVLVIAGDAATVEALVQSV